MKSSLAFSYSQADYVSFDMTAFLVPVSFWTRFIQVLVSVLEIKAIPGGPGDPAN